MSQLRTNTNHSPASFSRNWGWLLGLGILFVFLGFVGLGMVVLLTLASMFLLGALLIVASISQFIDVFKSQTWRAVVGHAIIALLYLIAGCLIIYDPLLASALITALIASVLIIIGLTRFIIAFRLKDFTGWGWFLFAGLVSILLGLMILLQWPISALWVIGLFIAIEIMVCGWAYIFIALASRRK